MTAGDFSVRREQNGTGEVDLSQGATWHQPLWSLKTQGPDSVTAFHLVNGHGTQSRR